MLLPSARFGALLSSLALAACSHTNVSPGFLEEVPSLKTNGFTCCAAPEKFYPAPVIEAAFSVADQVGPAVTGAMYNHYQKNGFPGKLENDPAAEAAMLAQLQPLDLVFTANKSYAWGQLIPGRFSHDLIYLGTEQQLRAAGLWDVPGFETLHDDIRAGRLFAQSVTPVSNTTTPDRVMESDGLAILRPQLSATDRRNAVSIIANNMGVPYDYTFDIRDTHRLSCTEFVNLSMPSLGIRPIEAYGRPVIIPDEIVSQAIRGDRLSVVGYLNGTDPGFVWRDTHSLMGDIAAYWGIPRGDL